MRNFFKFAAAGLVLSLAVSSQAMAQNAGQNFFSPESGALAIEAKADQAANDHKSAIKKLKKALKVKNLNAYETSAMEQMLGASYFATGKEDKAIEAFEDAIAAGGLSQTQSRKIRLNIAQLNIADKNYDVGAQQLETYFREGGAQSPKLVKMILLAYMREKNEAAALPWAEAMLRNNYVTTRPEHETLLYLFDSPEKRAEQMRVANKMLQLWPGDADVQTKVAGLKRKADYEATTPG